MSQRIFYSVEVNKTPTNHQNHTMKNITSTNHKVGKYEVSLSFQHGKWSPHAFEISTEETTNLSGYYAEGGLEIDKNKIVTGYDGVYSLPLPVALVLADLGFGFAPFVFPSDKAKDLFTK
jgi:hypothetical protein